MKNNNAWITTKITQLLKIRLPLIQAPMAGGATTPELVAAVSNAGGLGSLGAGYMTANEIRQAIRKIRQLTSCPFAINLFIPEKHQASQEQLEQARKIVEAACYELKFKINPIKPPYAPSFEEQINILIEEKVSIFSFTFGVLSEEWIALLKKHNTLLIGTATTLEEAKHLEKKASML